MSNLQKLNIQEMTDEKPHGTPDKNCWRDLPPTEKQLQLIQDLRDQSPYYFEGKTRGEASDFIDKALEEIHAANLVDLSMRGLDIYDN